METLPVLYYDDISPPVRFVLMTIQELNLNVKLHKVDLFCQDNRKVDFIEMNPLHRVPVLKDKDLIITDSHAICTYLVDKFAPDSQLYPKNIESRAKIDSILYFNSSIFFPRESVILQSPFKPIQDQPFSKMLDAYKESLSYLEAFCGKSKWLAGEQMTLADLCCMSTYASGELMIMDDKDSHPKIDAWMSMCKDQPCYKLAYEPGLKNLKMCLKLYGNFDHVDNEHRLYIDAKISEK